MTRANAVWAYGLGFRRHVYPNVCTYAGAPLQVYINI